MAYAKARVSNRTVRFEVGNALGLTFPSAEFDASLSLLVFNFLPDPSRALAELRRVTRPGGRICAATWDHGDGMEMLRIFWEAVGDLDVNAQRADEKYMRLCRSGDLISLWKGGLIDVEEQALEIAP